MKRYPLEFDEGVDTEIFINEREYYLIEFKKDFCILNYGVKGDLRYQ